MRADEVRSHIRWAIFFFFLGIVVLWCAYLARHALLIIYVSGLLAVGFSPMVRLIERQKALPIGSKRFPRWLAILLLYLVILGSVFLIGFLIFPPLVHQAQSLGVTVRGLTPSPIRGPAGNVEFLVWLSLEGGEEVDPEPLIDVAMAALSGEKG